MTVTVKNELSLTYFTAKVFQILRRSEDMIEAFDDLLMTFPKICCPYYYPHNPFITSTHIESDDEIESDSEYDSES